MRFYPKYAYSVIRYNILFYIVIILYRLFTFVIMDSNPKLPSIEFFKDIIQNLQNQITTTINVLSPLSHKNNYCYQTSNDLVKELLNIIYIPIKYEFFIKYNGKDIEFINDNKLGPKVFNPDIPENTYVTPSDILVISKLSLDIHSNSNTIIESHKRINTEFTENSENAYMYMFNLAFSKLNKIKPKLTEREIDQNLTIEEELIGPNDDKIHSRLSLTHSGMNIDIKDTTQSVWKSAFLYKKFALNVSFTTITVSSNGQNRKISILDPTIRTVDYEKLKIHNVNNTTNPNSSNKVNLKANNNPTLTLDANKGNKVILPQTSLSGVKLPPLTPTKVATPRTK